MLQSHQRLFHRTILTAEMGLALGGAFLCRMTEASTAVITTQLVVIAVAWLGISARIGLYRSHRTSSWWRELEALTATIFGTIATAAMVGLVMFDHLGVDARAWILVAAVPIYGLRIVVRGTLRVLRKRGRNFRRALIVGGGTGADAIARETERQTQLGIRIDGFVAFRGQREALIGIEQQGTVDDLQDRLRDGGVDVVVVCPTPRSTSAEISQVFELCRAAGIPCQFAPDFLRLDDSRPELEWYGGVPALSALPARRRSLGYAVKSVIDFVGALIGVALLSPVFLAIAVAIKLDSRGPILFRQHRVGRGGKTFGCFKFRTMVIDAEEQRAKLEANNEQDGPVFKIKHDPRITRLGRLLRKYSLDELPQLLNVLRGDMSLVGPRPPIPAEVERYEWWQRRRVSVRPGLTCIWQVQGRNRVSFQEWMEMDLDYLENWSLWLDFKILAGTAGTVLRGTGS